MKAIAGVEAPLGSVDFQVCSNNDPWRYDGVTIGIRVFT